MYGRYEAFDFHKECKKMQWHRLSLLLDRLAEDQASFGYVSPLDMCFTNNLLAICRIFPIMGRNSSQEGKKCFYYSKSMRGT